MATTFKSWIGGGTPNMSFRTRPYYLLNERLLCSTRRSYHLGPNFRVVSIDGRSGTGPQNPFYSPARLALEGIGKLSLSTEHALALHQTPIPTNLLDSLSLLSIHTSQCDKRGLNDIYCERGEAFRRSQRTNRLSIAGRRMNELGRSIFLMH